MAIGLHPIEVLLFSAEIAELSLHVTPGEYPRT